MSKCIHSDDDVPCFLAEGDVAIDDGKCIGCNKSWRDLDQARERAGAQKIRIGLMISALRQTETDTVVLDGVDISRLVSGVNIQARANELPSIQLHMLLMDFAQPVDIPECLAHVSVIDDIMILELMNGINAALTLIDELVHDLENISVKLNPEQQTIVNWLVTIIRRPANENDTVISRLARRRQHPSPK